MNNNSAGLKLEIGQIVQTKSNIIGILKGKKSVKTKAGVTDLFEISNIISEESYFVVESEINNVIRKYQDLGIEVATKESLDGILGTYAWDINKRTIVRILDVNNIGINCEVGVATIGKEPTEKLTFNSTGTFGVLGLDEHKNKKRYYEEVYYANLNSIFLLKPGSFVRLVGSDGMWIITKFSSILGEVSIKKYVTTDSKQLTLNKDINSISCFTEFFEIREQNTIDLLPLLTLNGEKTRQHIYKSARKLTYKKFKLGDLVSFSKVKDTLNSRYVATVVEEPSEDNFNYIGVLPMNREVLDLVTLLSGKQGIYLNPEEDITIITHGRNYAPQTNENVIVNKPFKSYDLKNLNNKILQQDQESVAAAKADVYSYEQPYVIEFEKDIGGHSGNGKGKPGHCISVEKCFIGAPRNNAKALATLLKNQKLIYISDKLLTEEVKCTDAELEKLLPSNKGLQEDPNKFIGIIFSDADDAEIKLDKDVPNHVLIYSSKYCSIIPVNCIEFVENSTPIVDSPEVKGRVQILKNMFGSKESKKLPKKENEETNYVEFDFMDEWPVEGPVAVAAAGLEDNIEEVYAEEDEHDND